MNKVQINSVKSDYQEIFERDGYVALQAVLSEVKLLRLRKDLQLIIDKHDHLLSKEDSLDKKIINLNKTNKKSLYNFQIEASKLVSLYALADDLLNIVEKFSYYDNKPLLEGVGYVLGIPDSNRLSYGWHQDGTYQEKMTGTRLHVWFPIFNDATLKNGCMTFLEGSHNLGVLGFKKIKYENMGYTTNSVENIDTIIEQHRHIACELSVGDCVIFNDSLIHRSNKNLTQFCRVAAVFKIRFTDNLEKHLSLVGI